MRIWTLVLGATLLLLAASPLLADDSEPDRSGGESSEAIPTERPADELAASAEPVDSDPASAPAAEPQDALSAADDEWVESAGDGAPQAAAVVELPATGTGESIAAEAVEPDDTADAGPTDEGADPLSAAEGAPAEDASWDDFDTATQVAESEAEVDAEGSESIPAPETSADLPSYAPARELGPLAVDPDGQTGRIHTVVRGDTLWDISTAYLGTPWVWPSVWKDNDEIRNPHVISPDDRIWITSGEMRVVTRQEADRMISAGQELAMPQPSASPDLAPAELIEAPEDQDIELLADVPAALDDLPVPVPLQPAPHSATGLAVKISEREGVGFVTREVIEGSSSIIDSPSPRTFLVDNDMVYIGMGEGKVEVGDEFTIFRNTEPVVDADTGRRIGYHVHILGWAVIRKVYGESSTAEIRMSQDEVQRGDRVFPREDINLTVPIKSTPDGIEGKIVFIPDDRTSVGDSDYVYLNRGSIHGYEVGSQVEVYYPGRLRNEPVIGQKVMSPDYVVAKMVMVAVKNETSVAFVVRARRELEVGNRVRAAAKVVASR
jgi:nucleoid-associated protein YgaU